MTIANLSTETTSCLIPDVESVSIQTALDCQPDNCLRQLEKASSIITPFCLTYTTSLNTYTISFPKDIANCAGNTNAISSACSCIMTTVLSSSTSHCSVPIPNTRTEFQTTTVLYTSTITPAPIYQVTNLAPLAKSLDCQADNCLRAIERGFPAIGPFCARYTRKPHQLLDLSADIANCESHSDAISSACSCVIQSSTSPTLTTAAAPVETELGEESTGGWNQGLEQGNWSAVDDWERDRHGSSETQKQKMNWWNWWTNKPSTKGSEGNADDFVKGLKSTLGRPTSWVG